MNGRHQQTRRTLSNTATRTPNAHQGPATRRRNLHKRSKAYFEVTVFIAVDANVCKQRPGAHLYKCARIGGTWRAQSGRRRIHRGWNLGELRSPHRRATHLRCMNFTASCWLRRFRTCGRHQSAELTWQGRASLLLLRWHRWRVGYRLAVPSTDLAAASTRCAD